MGQRYNEFVGNVVFLPSIMKYLRIALVFLALLPCLSFYGPGTPPTTYDPVAALASYPKDYFMAPINDPLLVTGTFGELRPNHFHAGLDLKSKNGAVGQPVFAAAEGYIDQIKVQASGYGNVLYIKHPNGYTTVYAHLDRFSPAIAALVKETQYKRERFEVVIDCPADKYRVQKGEEIGKMGNTGGSTGPHLHFEVRQNGRPLNPLLFGLPIPDSRPPDIRDMKLYHLSEQREVLCSVAFPVEKRKDGTYGMKGGADIYVAGAWRVGLGIKSYDQTDALRNDNGVYAISVYADGELVYGWSANSFHFDETRYMNSLCDYAANKRYGAWFYELFVAPGDKLSMYETTSTMGAIPLSASKTTAVEIKVADAAGNVTVAKFQLQRSENIEPLADEPFQYQFLWNEANSFTNGNFSLNMPKGCLYEDLKLKYHTTPDDSNNTYSEVHHVHNSLTPVHKFFEIGIVPVNLPDNLRDKAVIARCSGKKPDNCGAKWVGNKLTTQVRTLGDYCVMVDQTPPTIVPVAFDDDMRRKTSMSFRISDNFDATDRADDLYWRGTIDGAWILFELNSKNNRLTHVFDNKIGPGMHKLRLVVRDDRGNEVVWEKEFKR